MEICVLGPLRVTIAGRPVALPAKQRTLLAILAFQPNRTVSTDRLIVALWGEDASPTAIKTLQSHMFQLRRSLEPDTSAGEHGPTIVTDGRGYRLGVDPMAIDARNFEGLLAQGRAASTTDPHRAFGLLKEALALWRGPGLAEVGDEPLATAEIERLEELRASAFDELVQIRLALADYDGVIPELRRELSESPFREQLWASLMVALVRSGRKAEALLAYRDAKTGLRRELDVEPSYELQELAARIRVGDMLLVPAGAHPPRDPERTPAAGDRAIAESSAVGITSTGSGVAVGANRDAGRPSRLPPWIVHWRWRALKPSVRRPVSLVTVLSVALIVALFAARSLLDTSIPGPTPSTRAASTPASRAPVVAVVTDSVGRMDASGRLLASVRVGARPDAIALGAGSAWVTDATDDTVTRLDGSGSTVVQRIPVGGSPAGIAFGFGAVWVANSGGRTVSRIDPTTNAVVAEIQVGTAPTGIATDDRWVWVTNRLDHTLSRIDPNDESTKTFAVGATPLGVATAAGSAWVADSDSDLVVQVDAKSGAVRARVSVGNGPSALAATPQGDAVWVVNSRSGTVFRIDTTTANVTAAQAVGTDPTGIGIGTDGVWVAVPSTSEIVKLDSGSGQVIGRFPVGASPRSLVVDSAGPLFTARAVEGSHRGGTLSVVSPAEDFPVTADPSYIEGLNLGLALMTNDALVAYKKVGGPDGQTLVPDLASSIPASPDGGRTWTFQLRSGITYSNGAPLRPSDVLGSFERAVMAGNAATLGAGLYGNTEIIGSSACGAKPPCDLSQGITFDDQAGTVTFNLVAADPKFPSAITTGFIVPAGTPLTESSSPLPATGPYIVDRYQAGGEERLARNPHFHEWSKAAQPDGYPDAIDWTVSSLADPSSLVESGTADVMLGSTPSAERLAQLRIRVPAQLHVGPSQKTWVEMMNTNIPPFNDLRVRQAISYAADRQSIVQAWGGPLGARITCQVIPPEYTGYEPYCPYTVDPNANGSWLGPDLEKAKALIEQAGVKGQRVTVWGLVDAQHAAVARYFTALLTQLGFKATTRLLELGPYFTFLEASPDKVQMAGFWFLSSTRSGSDEIVGTFTCPDFPSMVPYAGWPADFCSRPIDANVTKAEALEATDPVAANHLWAQIDAAIVDATPAVAAFNPTDVMFVSERVGNYEHHPVYEIVLDQLWVQ